MSLDVVALGEPLFEFSQQADGRYLQGFGGDSSNAAIAASRLGARAGYLTLLGNDPFGDAFIDLWRREGVDCQHIRRHGSAPTGVYVITHTQQGHQFTYLRKGSAASLIEPADLPAQLFSATRWLHASGVSLAISSSATDTVFAAIDTASKAGAAISFDTNLRLRLWPAERARAIINAAAAKADVVKTSLEDALVLTGEQDPRRIAAIYLARGARSVAVTLGAGGCFAATAERSLQLPGHQVAAVDATGAGDAFMGALLAELCGGRDIFSAARFANAAAALSTVGYGAVAPLPRRDEVTAFLAAAADAP